MASCQPASNEVVTSHVAHRYDGRTREFHVCSTDRGPGPVPGPRGRLGVARRVLAVTVHTVLTVRCTV